MTMQVKLDTSCTISFHFCIAYPVFPATPHLQNNTISSFPSNSPETAPMIFILLHKSHKTKKRFKS